MNNLSWDFPYTSQRMPVLADNMVCTAQPLASAAGVTVSRAASMNDTG